MHDKKWNFYVVVLFLGVLTGVMGSLFQLTIIWLDSLIAQGLSYATLQGASPGLVSMVLSLLMVLTAYLLVRYVARDASGSGIPEIEGMLMHRLPIVWTRLLPVKFLGGLLAISAKMTLGREGPLVQMGGYLGGMLNQLCHVAHNRWDTLIAAGAGAGLAAAFNAPIAGVLFVLEEIHHVFHFSFSNLKTVVMCCLIAAITRDLFLGTAPIIRMVTHEAYPLMSLWIFFVFGLAVGLLGIVFNQALTKCVYYLGQCSNTMRIVFVMLVGCLVGVVSFFHPDAVGEGYDVIHHVLTVSPSSMSLLVWLLVRLIALMLCYSAGVPGGIFSPMLALGTLFGLMFFQLFQWLNVDTSIHAHLFAAVGMGGLFAATVRAPLTGIVLVIEITQNYSLILPLMITCFTATMLMKLTRNAPIYVQLLKQELQKTGQYNEKK